jgi:hypothetical protein
MSDSWKYVGDDAREIPALRITIKPGDTFTVEDKQVSKGLEGQDVFEKVKATSTSKTTTKDDTIT